MGIRNLSVACRLVRTARHSQVGGRDFTIILWDVATGNTIRTFEGHTWNVDSVSFSPDGKLLASGGGDYTILLWDVAPELT